MTYNVFGGMLNLTLLLLQTSGLTYFLTYLLSYLLTYLLNYLHMQVEDPQPESEPTVDSFWSPMAPSPQTGNLVRSTCYCSL